MTALMPTLRGFCNTWDCDEVGHMNVQLYVARFWEAAQFAVANLGLDPSETESKGELVRFHRELRTADLYTIRSGLAEHQGDTITLYHEMQNPVTRELSATAITRHLVTDMTTDLPDSFASVPDAGKPRSLDLASRLPHLTLADAIGRSLFETSRIVLTPSDYDAQAKLTPRTVMGRFSDGAPHLWQALGMDRGEMRRRNLGSIVVEVRLDHYALPPAGTRLIAFSALKSVLGKALQFAHFLFDDETGDLVATSEAIALMLDMEARRTVPFSDEEMTRLSPYVVAL